MSDTCPKCNQIVRDDVIRCTNIDPSTKQACYTLLEKRIFARKQLDEKASRATVFPASKDLFPESMKTPKSSLIGIVTTDDFKFYFAPCYGVTETCPACKKTYVSPAGGCTKHSPYQHDTKCISADLTDSAGEISLKDVTARYKRNECLVYLSVNDYSRRNFGPNSHNALARWINQKGGKSLPLTGMQGGINSVQDDGLTLGFSIQHDDSGSYIRFASGRNEMKFQPRMRLLTELIVESEKGVSHRFKRGSSDDEKVRFVTGPTAALVASPGDVNQLKKPSGAGANTARPKVNSVDPFNRTVVSKSGYTGAKSAAGDWELRATRDMPKAWFNWGCTVLANELGLDLKDLSGKHERYSSRDEGTTKKWYFTVRR